MSTYISYRLNINMFWHIFEEFIQTFFIELGERMFNFVSEKMWIKVKKYNEN